MSSIFTQHTRLHILDKYTGDGHKTKHKGGKEMPINTYTCHERTNVENFLNKIRVFGIIWIKIKGVMVFSSPELKAQLSFSECLFVHASV